MADKKPTGFRFRLPWLLQPAPTPTPAPEPSTQPLRTSTQTSAASTSAPRPPFKPPGKAPAPPTAPVSPAQARPQAVATPPPVPAKPSVPKSSPIAKTIEPVATKPTKETQTTNETSSLETSPQRSPVRTIRQAGSQPSPPQSPPSPNLDSQSSSPSRVRTPPQSNSQPLSPSRMATQPQPSPPQSPRPTKSDSPPSSPSRTHTPPQTNSQQLSPSRMATQPQPSPPRSPLSTKPESPPSSPSRIHTPPQANSQPSSPSRMPTQPHVPTKRSSPSHEATRSRAITHPLSPILAQPSQTHTQSRSPSRSPSRPTNEISLSSPHTKTISSPRPHHTPEIRRSSEITQDHIPKGSNYVPHDDDDLELHAKPTKTRLMYPHSIETKTHKPKPTTTTRIPLHRKIKDDISKIIHNVTTSTPKQSTDEKSTSVITLAGDNTGAAMHLSSDAIRRDYNRTTNKTDHDAINKEGQETKAIINSNIQGINNSMMFNSSSTERNPGVHLTITHTLANTEDLNMKDTESVEMQRAEVNITPPHNLVYDPTNDESIAGVFEEPSEYEQDDHEVSANEIEVL